MSDEYKVTVYEATSSKKLVTTLYFDGADELVSEVRRRLVRMRRGDSDKIVFLNHHVAERDEGGDGGARRILDADRICMIADYEDDGGTGALRNSHGDVPTSLARRSLPGSWPTPPRRPESSQVHTPGVTPPASRKRSREDGKDVSRSPHRLYSKEDVDCAGQIQVRNGFIGVDNHVGQCSSAQPQRFILRYSVRTAEDNEFEEYRNASQCGQQ